MAVNSAGAPRDLVRRVQEQLRGRRVERRLVDELVAYRLEPFSATEVR